MGVPGPLLAECFQRYLRPGRNLRRNHATSAGVSGPSDDGFDDPAAVRQGQCRQCPQDLDNPRLDADLFLGFTQRGGNGSIDLRFGAAPGQDPDTRMVPELG